MYPANNLDKPDIDKSLQAVNSRFDQPCYVVLSDSISTEIIEKPNVESSRRWSLCGRYKRILLIGAALLIGLNLIVEIIFAIMLLLSHVQDTSDRAGLDYLFGETPLSQVEMVVDGNSSFNDWTELTNKTMENAEDNSIKVTETRGKRQVSREKSDCDMNAEHCAILLQSMYKYLGTLENQLFDQSRVSTFENILKCLKYCKNLKSTTAGKFDEDSATRSSGTYLPYVYVGRNHSPGSTAIEISGNTGDNEGRTRVGGDRAEGDRVDLPEIVDSRIAKTKSTVASLDRTNSDETLWMHINRADIDDTDKQSNGGSIANYSHVAKIQNDTNVSATLKDVADGHRAVDEAKILPSNVVSLNDAVESKESATTATWTKTNGEATRNTDSATSQLADNQLAAGHDVIGIGYDVAASPMHPSFEGHPEDQTTMIKAVTEPMSIDRFTKDNAKSDSHKQIGESTEGIRQLTSTWTIPHLVCYPDQLFNKQSLHPNSFDSSSLQNHKSLLLQTLFPLSMSSSSSSWMPNYVQEQAQSQNATQFMMRLDYPDNLARPQPTGLAASNIPLNQQQPIPFSARYYCTYISALTLPFSPISDTSHFSRSSSNEAEASEKLSKRLNTILTAGFLHNPEHYSACPLNSRRCASDEYCILKVKWCDGRVDCADASDETMCSCRDRISRDRLCDGYLDCPHGEDEIGCFNCPDDSFSCDGWNQRHNHDNCVPLSQRCDGVDQCHNGKDELDCNILSASYINGKDISTIGHTEGYLHKNVRGQWYPVCSGETFWAMDACASETGQSITITPKIEMVRVSANDFSGPYLNGSDGYMRLVDSCSDSAMFVKCPPLPCGISFHPHQNSFLASTRSDTTATSYMEYNRHMEEQSVFDSDELYLETLKLLDEKYPAVEGNKEDGNDTLVEPLLGVVGGRASEPKDWPFLVAIYEDGDFRCDGVILTEVWILTAAHCMVEYEKHYYEVQAGALRRLSFSPTVQWRKARNVLTHAGFNSHIIQNDIALIMLDERLLFNRWVRQACLPADSEWKLEPTPQSTCVVVGWGAMEEFGPDTDQLREVEMPILSSCKYSSDRNDATICAGYSQGGHDACQGDSGGPLMCRDPSSESQFYVAGVISHGNGCARPDEPGAYTRVSYFMRWIQKQIEEFEPTLFTNESTPLAKCPGFSCRRKFGRCLPIGRRCDRVVDCLDAEDEVGCFWQVTDGRGRQSDSVEMEMRKMPTGQRTADEIRHGTTLTLNGEQVRIDDNVASRTIDATMPETTPSVRSTFTCTSLIQTITIGKRCDKRLDCEDGTDEEGCTCRDYLSNSQPTAICDGHLDCDDETDEENCGTCTEEDEFHCGRSGTCIPVKSRCDGKYDCALKEDEVDCLALTNGEYLNVDSDDRPALNAAGLLARYTNGTWRTECLESVPRDNDTLTARMGERVCRYLGFRNVQSVERVNVNRIKLEVRPPRGRRDSATGYEAGDVDGPCSALRIHCRPVLSGSADSHLIVNPKTGSRTYLWPWLATIFVDGRFRCSAVLLKRDWILSNLGCTRDIRLSVNYTTALLGYSRSYLYVDGPYQQISVVDEIKEVRHSKISLLHLRTAVNLTRHVLPLFLQEKIYPPEDNDLCVAVGTGKEYTTHSVFLQPVLENCDKCHRCFVERSECSSNDTRTVDWAGTVVCHGQEGWYPAAVFHERNGPCSFQSTRNLTSIDYVQAYIAQILDRKWQPTTEATCDGIRCNIGQCVSWDRVCDGVVDCRDAVDEMEDTCDRAHQRTYDVNRKCAKTKLRCGNGECMAKSTFCDGKVDCSDGTDEPVNCTCAEYLRLTAPERLCDGVRHCFDKTDESPDVCRCTDTSFKCDTESGNSICIPQDFVCDGDQDCPNGRDEERCRKLDESAYNKSGMGEVQQRSYGVWHSQCFSAPVTSEEAKTACKEIGYTNGTIDRENRISREPVVPSRDYFYTIRVNLETWVTMRNNKPLINLVRPDDPCYRLFVKCA